MVTAWSGGTPNAFADSGATYELWSQWHTYQPVQISAVRVWCGNTSTSFPGRQAYIRASNGALLATINLPDSLSPGWNAFALADPINIASGLDFWVSYGTLTNYGALTGVSIPVFSSDGSVAFQAGGFSASIGNSAPSAQNTTFYGIDFTFDIYDPGAGEAPVVTASASTTNLTTTLTLQVVDESPATVSYSIRWGDGTTTGTGSTGPHTHTYATAGLYAIVVVATDEVGNLGITGAAVQATAPVTGRFAPTTELVVVAWLKGIAFVGNNVSTSLPANNTSWAASGFVQVTPVGGGGNQAPGGESSMYAPISQPVVTLDCYAVAPNSSRPPWNKAFQLAQQIWKYMLRTPELVARDVTLPEAYSGARVLSAWPVSEPRRIRSDPADYAHVSFDIELRWRETQ